MSQDILNPSEIRVITNMMMYNVNNIVTKLIFMEKQCTKCQQVLDISSFSKDKYKKSGHRSACKQCSNLEYKSFQKTDGYKNRLRQAIAKRNALKEENPIKRWAFDTFHSAKSRAKAKHIEFSITKEWLEENAIESCPLLGVKLIYNSDRSSANTASLDRKIPSLGYTKENCKIISFKANRIKNDANLHEIETLLQNLRNY